MGRGKIEWKNGGRRKKEEAREKIVAKALDGQRYPLPLCEYM